MPSTDAEGHFDLHACADDPVNKRLSAVRKKELFRSMVRIRRFEERCLRVYQQGKIGGFLHLYIGQEAVAVGAVSVMEEDDHLITAYRDHGHALAVGMGMNELMAELTGKVTGCSKGKGGSMHFFAPDKKFWGGHGIVGGQVPLGTGIAFALKFQGKKGCCLTFMGDGAVNQGSVHEAYNLAELWDLPVLFVIENNGYSMGTSQERSSAYPAGGLAARATGYNMEWDRCNGHLLYEVRAKVSQALKQIHKDSRPRVLEIDTYRYRGHSVADPDKTYRTKKEIEDYRKNKDPLSVFETILKEQMVLDNDEARAIDTEAKEEAENAVKFAESSPYPDASEILRDVYWEADNGRTSQGRLFFETD